MRQPSDDPPLGHNEYIGEWSTAPTGHDPGLEAALLQGGGQNCRGNRVNPRTGMGPKGTCRALQGQGKTSSPSRLRIQATDENAAPRCIRRSVQETERGIAVHGVENINDQRRVTRRHTKITRHIPRDGLDRETLPGQPQVMQGRLGPVEGNTRSRKPGFQKRDGDLAAPAANIDHLPKMLRPRHVQQCHVDRVALQLRRNVMPREARAAPIARGCPCNGGVTQARRDLAC